jgi:hypothetical protein
MGLPREQVRKMAGFKPIPVVFVALANIALALLSQRTANAAFLVEQGSRWHAVGDDADCHQSTVVIRDAGQQAGSLMMFEYPPQLWAKEVARFDATACSKPGGMSSTSSDTAGPSGLTLLTTSAVRLADALCSAWVRLEFVPRPPRPLGAGILRPPRSRAVACHGNANVSVSGFCFSVSKIE